MKYFRINLTKDVQELYTESYETLLRDIKQELNKWGNILCSFLMRDGGFQLTLFELHRTG